MLDVRLEVRVWAWQLQVRLSGLTVGAIWPGFQPPLARFLFGIAGSGQPLPRLCVWDRTRLLSLHRRGKVSQVKTLHVVRALLIDSNSSAREQGGSHSLR